MGHTQTFAPEAASAAPEAAIGRRKAKASCMPTGCPTDRLTDRPADRLVGRQTTRQRLGFAFPKGAGIHFPARGRDSLARGNIRWLGWLDDCPSMATRTKRANRLPAVSAPPWRMLWHAASRAPVAMVMVSHDDSAHLAPQVEVVVRACSFACPPGAGTRSLARQGPDLARSPARGWGSLVPLTHHLHAEPRLRPRLRRAAARRARFLRGALQLLPRALQFLATTPAPFPQAPEFEEARAAAAADPPPRQGLRLRVVEAQLAAEAHVAAAAAALAETHAREENPAAATAADPPPLPPCQGLRVAALRRRRARASSVVARRQPRILGNGNGFARGGTRRPTNGGGSRSCNPGS